MANVALLSLFTLQTFILVTSQTPSPTLPPTTQPPTTTPPPPLTPPRLPPTGISTSRPGNESEQVVNTTTGTVSVPTRPPTTPLPTTPPPQPTPRLLPSTDISTSRPGNESEQVVYTTTGVVTAPPPTTHPPTTYPPPPPPTPPPPLPTGFTTSRPGNETEHDVVVNTTTGMVSGFTDGSANFYLGLPYAAAPKGNLRFAKPHPHAPWDGIYEALEYGKQCPSKKNGIGGESDEDCLTLNIFVPSEARGGNSLPVMIYFHPGGFTGGSSGLLSGENLAAFGEVIIVTVNYRLGIFGFLSTGDDCARGNWGLWDQQLAIQWVDNNAQRFGGNPDKITIFGSSSGADSVLLQGLSPVNTNKLFQRIISESAIQFNFLRNDNNFAAEQTMLLAENLGFDRTNDTTLMEFLRNQDPESLLAASEELTWFYPVIDGEFITEPWTFTNPSRLNQYDLLVGVNTGDAAAWYARLSILNNGDEPVVYEGGISKDNFQFYTDYIIKTFCGDLPICDDRGAAVQAAIFKYNDIKGLNDELMNFKRALEMGVEASFFSFASTLARTHLQGNGATYVYEFAYDMAVRPPPFTMISPDLVPNPIHRTQTIYIEGTELPTQDDITLSYAFQSYWSNFARSGDPNIGNTEYISSNPAWPKFDLSTKSYMILKPNATVGQNYAADAYDFWYGYVNDLLEEGEDSESCVVDAGVPVWESLSSPETTVYDIANLGLISGSIVHVSDALGAPDKVNVIHGIPYAKPPIDSLRFAPPEEAGPWKGLLDGISPAPGCPEANVEDWNEDCLTLDVTFVNSSNPLPVIVFIGGHNFQNGGIVPSAENLAVGAKSVVVTFRYRVGALGFLSTGDKYAPGNYGLRDILAVLNWVKMNIGKSPFNGDSNKVTVMGYGNGGSIVNLLFYSKLSEGLFQHAVSLGGTATSRSLHIPNQPDPIEQAISLGETVGCRGTTDELMSCLRSKNVTVSVILSASESLEKPYLFFPVVDAEVLEDSIQNLMQTSAYPTTPVNYLIGIIENQEAARPMGMMDGMDSCPSEAQFKRKVNSVIGMYMSNSNTIRRNIATAIVSEYLDNLPAPIKNETCPILGRFLKFLQDFFVVIPTLQTANSHISAGGTVYLYNFQQSPKYRTNNTAHLPQSVGPALGDDIQYLFGWPYSQDAPGCYGPDDRETTMLLMRIFHHFVESGEPSEQLDLAAKEWPAYDLESKQYLEVDACPSISQDFGSKSRLRFWSEIIPLLQQTTPTAPQDPCIIDEGLGVTLTASEASLLIQILIGVIIAILVLYLIVCGACCGQRKQLSESKSHAYELDHDIPGGWRPHEDTSDML